jgi:D-glycero-alpha-D-manno-heptose-7-phosphate kinase
MSEKAQKRRLCIINSVAPIRICDNGGWTDTWFAEYGKVFNIGVYPYDDQKEHVVIYGERYVRHLEKTTWDRHPLLEAAIERMGVPDDIAIQVIIFCEAPAGASTGTSAAVTVALVGALDRLTPGRLTPHEVAYMAHSVETDMLKQQCGIQDQLCSAYGGINYIEML